MPLQTIDDYDYSNTSNFWNETYFYGSSNTTTPNSVNGTSSSDSSNAATFTGNETTLPTSETTLFTTESSNLSSSTEGPANVTDKDKDGLKKTNLRRTNAAHSNLGLTVFLDPNDQEENSKNFMSESYKGFKVRTIPKKNFALRNSKLKGFCSRL